MNGNAATMKATAETFNNTSDCMKKLYKERMLPLESQFGFHSCHSPAMTEADFNAVPMVLLIGQYSVGKSTFVKHLLGRDYPGLRIGPEPTTDKFFAICHGSHDQVIPGAAAIMDPKLPYTQLVGLGNAFAERFDVSKMNCPILEGMTLIDTPGVLSGEKQRISRGYLFEAVVKWFADRVDCILIIFDVSKLDISDEFHKVMEAAKTNANKIHVLLNKADRCSTPQLMRVYGALMWNLHRVMDTPEITRVYIGSFWDEPLQSDENKPLFEHEENELYSHLAQLPKQSSGRKVNDMIKRARLLKVHVHLLDYLRDMLPMFGKEEKQQELILQLPGLYKEVASKRGLSLGDFPPVEFMQRKLLTVSFKQFPKLEKRMIDALDHMLSVEMPKLCSALPMESKKFKDLEILHVGCATPFGGSIDDHLRVNPEEHRELFESFGPINGRLGADKLKEIMEGSQLPKSALHRIWTLAKKASLNPDEEDAEGMDLWQFSVAMKLVQNKVNNKTLPTQLPSAMVPTASEIKALENPKSVPLELPGDLPEKAKAPEETFGTPTNLVAENKRPSLQRAAAAMAAESTGTSSAAEDAEEVEA